MNNKSTKYVLLIIGILGIVASIVGLYQNQSVVDQLIPMVAGLSLIWGFYELNKNGSKEQDKA